MNHTTIGMRMTTHGMIYDTEQKVEEDKTDGYANRIENYPLAKWFQGLLEDHNYKKLEQLSVLSYV